MGIIIPFPLRRVREHVKPLDDMNIPQTFMFQEVPEDWGWLYDDIESSKGAASETRFDATATGVSAWGDRKNRSKL